MTIVRGSFSVFGSAGLARQRNSALLFCLLFVVTLFAPPVQAAEAIVQTQSGVHTFSVEVMQTPSERSQGLMFRKSMPDNHGAFFNFDQEQPIQMWMKNTYIPLDMIFISSSGRVVSIARDTVPLSTDIIPSVLPAQFVLEVVAGTVDRIGLTIGDSVALSQ